MVKPRTRTSRAALAVVAMLAIGCGEANDPTGGVAERTEATRAADAQRNLAAAQTAEARTAAAPRS